MPLLPFAVAGDWLRSPPRCALLSAFEQVDLGDTYRYGFSLGVATPGVEGLERLAGGSDMMRCLLVADDEMRKR